MSWQRQRRVSSSLHLHESHHKCCLSAAHHCWIKGSSRDEKAWMGINASMNYEDCLLSTFFESTSCSVNYKLWVYLLVNVEFVLFKIRVCCLSVHPLTEPQLQDTVRAPPPLPNCMRPAVGDRQQPTALPQLSSMCIQTHLPSAVKPVENRAINETLSNFFLPVCNCWIELARPIWCSKWPNSPGSEGSERGGDGKEGEGAEEDWGGGLKTDQQLEDLNSTACLRNNCRVKPNRFESQNFLWVSKKKNKKQRFYASCHVSLLKTRARPGKQRTHLLQKKMDCKKKLDVTSAPHWSSLSLWGYTKKKRRRR